MSHLVAISIGPVQEFIVAARRTRDLWLGSYLLSEVSRAVAKSVESQGGKLIFPASSNTDNVANIVLAELNAADPKEIVANAKKAAQNCWLGFTEQSRHEASGIIREVIWNDQVNDVIEFYAAWVTRSENYQAARARLMHLLAGRKNFRDFLPAKGQAGVPKSSLDGQRETVLKDEDRIQWPKRIRLSLGEQLDVIGVTKRLAKKKGESDPSYPSVARVAAETWLRGTEKRGELQRLRDACQGLVSKGLHTVREEQYKYFPYEGTIIYKDRHSDLRKELGLDERDLDDIATALKEIGGEPNPYLAVLVADGDKMGEALSRLESVDAHQAFSKALAGFADKAQTIVNEHNGVLVYAGGDDVLAFVPVDKCLDCSRNLHDKFAELMKDYGSPTLSVGVAIGHFMENLEDLLEYGRAAEQRAKQPDRDGFAIHLHKRGGSPIQMRTKWTESPDARLAEFAEMLNQGAIPAKLPYELRNMAKLYENWPTATKQEKEIVAEAIRQDVLRVITKKQSLSGGIRNRLTPYLTNLTATSLRQLAEELLIARQIAAALRQAEDRQERLVGVAS